MRKALFLDRDGVINEDSNYVYKIEDFFFKPEIFNICHKYQNDGYLIFVVTNQAGIARGYYTLQDYFTLTNWMIDQFKCHGITITSVYFCPHHPDITGWCNCRKPMPGMILKASEEFNLYLPESCLIGDNESDLQAGYRAGIKNCFNIRDILDLLS